MTRKQLRFFRRSIREVAESLFLHDVINSDQCHGLRSFPSREVGKLCARELFSRREANLAEYPIHLRLKRLREINGRSFEHIQIVIVKQRPRRVCFVGHRFLPQVSSALRWNLRQVLEPYNVQLDWSGKDIRSVQIFDDIVERITRADFCIFDNRATTKRPNVSVEEVLPNCLRRWNSLHSVRLRQAEDGIHPFRSFPFFCNTIHDLSASIQGVLR